MIKLHLADGEKALKEMDENQYDLAIVDPPYGIQVSKTKGMGQGSIKQKYIATSYKPKLWDNAKPNKTYFNELKAVSKNQIIWGYNYFASILGDCRGCIIWDKMQGDNDFSAAEICYTSFDKSVKKFTHYPGGNRVSNNKKAAKKYVRIHPTQKPIALYKWLLKNYAFNKDGSKRTILDTHFGSLSIGIACADMGFDLTAYEIDEDYFNAAVKRLHNHINQLNAFTERPEVIVNGIPIDQWINRPQIKR